MQTTPPLSALWDVSLILCCWAMVSNRISKSNIFWSMFGTNEKKVRCSRVTGRISTYFWTEIKCHEAEEVFLGHYSPSFSGIWPSTSSICDVRLFWGKKFSFLIITFFFSNRASWVVLREINGCIPGSTKKGVDSMSATSIGDNILIIRRQSVVIHLMSRPTDSELCPKTVSTQVAKKLDTLYGKDPNVSIAAPKDCMNSSFKG